MSGRHPLEALFRPASIAVVGASSDPAKLGGRPLHNLLRLGYAGRVYPVNPAAAEVQGVRAWRSVADLPETPEQALVVVPANAVEAALEQCAAKGIRVVQILSAGFAEVGGEGAAMQARVVETARRAGMRITGPNALGSISPPDGFFATFSSSLATLRPPSGRIGFATQSGAFGSHAYAAASLRNLGISRAVATGNEADIDVAACVDYLAEDPGTGVICAALEGCRDGDRLRAALLKAAAAGKPTVVMKVGRTEVGAAAAATHSGALAGEDRIFDAVFRECGAWRARSIEEMIDFAHLCATGAPPSNAEVAIVTLSGGIGVLMADAAVEGGLSVPALPPEVLARIGAALPLASGRNPIDTTAQVAGQLQSFEGIIEAILDGAGLGTVLVYLAHIGRNPARFPPLEEALARLRRRFPERRIVLCMTSTEEARSRLDAVGIPVFEDPSRAVLAVAAAAALRRLQREAEPLPTVPARAPLAAFARHEAGAKALLAQAGVPVPPEHVCATPEEAVRAAQDLGFPVAAKILSEDIPHKTEVGGVMLGLADAAAVERAFTELTRCARAARPDARIAGVLVAPMVRDGLETVIGVQRDPVFGPMVMFGLGGVAVELFADVAFASAPLSPARAARLVRQVRGARLLDGWRGSPALDRAALEAALCSVAALAAAQPEIASIDVNPFLVRPSGGVALDAMVVTREAGAGGGA